MIFVVNCHTGCTKCYIQCYRAETHCLVSVIRRQRMEQSSVNCQLLVQLVTTPHLPLLHIQAKEHQGKCMLENTIKYADYQKKNHLLCVLHYYTALLYVVYNNNTVYLLHAISPKARSTCIAFMDLNTV